MIRYIASLLLAIAFTTVNAQCIKGDCENGKGTFEMGGGMKYVGDFVEGKQEGLGILFFDNGDHYVGEWQAGVRQGRGKFHFSSGTTYFGQFENNKFHGQGEMTYARGDVFNGEFIDGVPQGEGVFTFVDGSEYVGHLRRGKFDGYGVMVYEDRSVYDGHWESGKWHGTGVYTNEHGESWTGQWKQGIAVRDELSESGVETEELASTAENVTTGVSTTRENPLADKPKKNNAHPRHTQQDKPLHDINVSEMDSITFDDGSLYTGEVKNGIPYGRGEVAYSSGNRYEGYWRDNAPHGEGTMYYTSGRVISAVWNRGEPIRDLQSLDQLSLESIIVPDVSDEVKIWAMIVGISTYDNLPGLKYADDDAYQVYAFLKSPEGGALPDEQIRLVIDESATIPNILSQMQALFYKADENDVVLMFYSGHGLDGSFVPIDYNGRNDLLDHSKLKEVFDKSSARHKICIADACYSGSLAVDKKINAEFMQAFYSEYDEADPGMAFLLSSKEKEVSLEDKGLKQGIFSHFLIRGIKGEADDNDNGIVTIGELFGFLYESVSKYTGGQQTPILSGEFDENMPLGMKRSYLDY